MPLKAGFGTPRGLILPGIKASVVGFLLSTWLRQQENALAATSHDLLENADPTLRARLGLRTYGTLGNVNGTKVPQQRVAFGSVDVDLPDFLIGENAQLIPSGKTRLPDNPQTESNNGV